MDCTASGFPVSEVGQLDSSKRRIRGCWKAVDEILGLAWIEVEIEGMVVRRYAVFLYRRWYFWGGVFLVDFGQDVIFSTRCSMPLIASPVASLVPLASTLLSDHDADELLCLN